MSDEELTVKAETKPAFQLSFDLLPLEPFSLKYFVPHSGVAAAYTLLEQVVKEVSEEKATFRSVYAYGPAGVGKQHLLEGFAASAVKQGLLPHSVAVVSLTKEKLNGECGLDVVSAFIATYEQLKASGGLLLSSGEEAPAQLSSNPHLTSRLLAGAVVSLSYPCEDEIHPLLLSLLERRNLKLSERNLEYLLRRLPLEPLSFDAIFARISELCYQQGKGAGLTVIREAVASHSKGKSGF